MTVTGWKLDREERSELLERFEPAYANVVADHVTLRLGGDALPPQVTAQIVGRADDGAGVEAMVVAIDGTTDRPDGSTFHITWSLDEGRKAKESNEVIKTHGWQGLELPLPVTLQPARF